MTDKHEQLVDEHEESYRRKYPNTAATTTSGSGKGKKYALIAILTVVVLAGAGTGVYFLLKKDEPVDPVDPVDPTVYYDPYEVEETDPAKGLYTIKRNTKLTFDYPYQESTNNKFIDTLQLAGSAIGNAFNLQFTPSSMLNQKDKSWTESPIEAQ